MLAWENMDRTVLFRDFPPMDELLDTYFPDDDCSFNSARDHHFDELVSKDGDMESFEWRPPLSSDHDTSSTEPQCPQSVQDSIEHINDEDLINLPIRDLNKRLRNLPKAEMQKLRKRRRSLKNRTYATRSRQRRTDEKEGLKTQNQRLRVQLRETKANLKNVMLDRDSYKNKYESLHTEVCTVLTDTTLTEFFCYKAVDGYCPNADY